MSNLSNKTLSTKYAQDSVFEKVIIDGVPLVTWYMIPPKSVKSLVLYGEKRARLPFVDLYRISIKNGVQAGWGIAPHGNYFVLPNLAVFTSRSFEDFQGKGGSHIKVRYKLCPRLIVMVDTVEDAVLFCSSRQSSETFLETIASV